MGEAETESVPNADAEAQTVTEMVVEADTVTVGEAHDEGDIVLEGLLVCEEVTVRDLQLDLVLVGEIDEVTDSVDVLHGDVVLLLEGVRVTVPDTDLDITADTLDVDETVGEIVKRTLKVPTVETVSSGDRVADAQPDKEGLADDDTLILDEVVCDGDGLAESEGELLD